MAKTIRNSRSGEYKRVTNDVAVQLVSSGGWVYSSKFDARQADPHQPAQRGSARRQSHLLKGLEIAGVLLALICAVILMMTLVATAARAADKPVPYRVCLTQSQAAQVYKGKKLKYRLVKDDHGRDEACWYAGKTLPKYAFIPRSTSVAARPTRLITQQEQTRVEEPSGAAPDPGITHTDYRALMEDAFLALTGRSEESYVSFDAYWKEMTGFAQ